MNLQKQSGTPIPPPNRNGGCSQSIQQPEIIIRLKRGELTKKEEVIDYCKKNKRRAGGNQQTSLRSGYDDLNLSIGEEQVFDRRTTQGDSAIFSYKSIGNCLF